MSDNAILEGLIAKLEIKVETMPMGARPNTWLAKDKDGTWWGFIEKPHHNMHEWIRERKPNESMAYAHIRDKVWEECRDNIPWEESLIYINHDGKEIRPKYRSRFRK